MIGESQQWWKNFVFVASRYSTKLSMAQNHSCITIIHIFGLHPFIIMNNIATFSWRCPTNSFTSFPHQVCAGQPRSDPFLRMPNNVSDQFLSELWIDTIRKDMQPSALMMILKYVKCSSYSGTSARNCATLDNYLGWIPTKNLKSSSC